MGLVIKIKNILSTNNFKLFYRVGRTPGSSFEQSSTSWGTQYGGIFSGGTDLISIDLIDSGIDTNPYSKQYWFKILDDLNGSFIIENIYVHDEIFYSELCIDCRLSGTAVYYEPDCSLSGNAVYTSP
jgi:hypothetical protein